MPLSYTLFHTPHTYMHTMHAMGDAETRPLKRLPTLRHQRRQRPCSEQEDGEEARHCHLPVRGPGHVKAGHVCERRGAPRVGLSLQGSTGWLSGLGCAIQRRALPCGGEGGGATATPTQAARPAL